MQDHQARAKRILQTHPELRALFCSDPTSGVWAIGAAALHLCAAQAASQLSLWPFLLACYAVGAPCAQNLFLAIHEASHDLFFRTALKNRWFSIALNLPLLFPFAIVFRKYHLPHHAALGTSKDFDLPTQLECDVFVGKIGKFVWLAFQLFFYALRPLFLETKPLCALTVANVLIQCAFDAWLLASFGPRCVAYLFLSLFFAGGLHPTAGHFLSEHVVFDPDKEEQETFSYYGPWNFFMWNVGAHVEHHDFPAVPCKHLLKVRELAPEYYALTTRTSYARLLARFVADDGVALRSCRARRAKPANTTACEK